MLGLGGLVGCQDYRFWEYVHLRLSIKGFEKGPKGLRCGANDWGLENYWAHAFYAGSKCSIDFGALG